jgi:multiple antibiotic resistance protein
MGFKIDELLTIVFTLFAVIDIVGSIPLLIAMKEKSGTIKSLKVTLISGALMIFLLGLEMVLGHEIFKGDKNAQSGAVVPIAFPIIAGSGTLTTIMSLKANYDELYIALGILINLVIVYAVLKSLNFIEGLLGPGGLLAVRKFFGVILIAIAVKIFSSNVGALIR